MIDGRGLTCRVADGPAAVDALLVRSGWRVARDPAVPADVLLSFAPIVADLPLLRVLPPPADSDARAAALAAGADDVAPADCGPAELLARLGSLVRRARPAPLRIGGLAIDPLARTATRDGRPLGLLPREYALLLRLARASGAPVDRDTLLRDVWRLRFDPGTNVVRVHVSRLRARLDRDFARPMLLTVPGQGYRLAEPAAGG